MKAKSLLVIFLTLPLLVMGQEPVKDVNYFSQFAPGAQTTNPQAPLAVPAAPIPTSEPQELFQLPQTDKKPSAEDIVTFKDDAVVCLSEDKFIEFMNHLVNKEITLARAMLEDGISGCAHFDTSGKFKILKTDYRDDYLNQYIEFSGVSNQTGTGAWTSIGFIKEIVQKPNP